MTNWPWDYSIYMIYLLNNFSQNNEYNFTEWSSTSTIKNITNSYKVVLLLTKYHLIWNYSPKHVNQTKHILLSAMNVQQTGDIKHSNAYYLLAVCLGILIQPTPNCPFQ